MSEPRELDILAAEGISISPAAAAVLEFTSDIGEPKHAGQLTYITSKQSYIWAGLAAYIAESTQSSGDKHMSDAKIYSLLYDTVNTPGINKSIIDSISPPYLAPTPVEIAQSGEAPFIQLHRAQNSSDVGLYVFSRFIDNLRLHDVINAIGHRETHPYIEVLHRINNNISGGYNEANSR